MGIKNMAAVESIGTRSKIKESNTKNTFFLKKEPVLRKKNGGERRGE